MEARFKEMKVVVFRAIQGRWFMVFAGSLIMSVAGATYMFGLYSNDIKSSLGYDQTTLNLLSFFKDLGANVGIFSGLINEVTPPWVILSIGILMNFFGYFMIWLAVDHRIPKPKVWQMCLYICIGANSQAFANTGALVSSVMNFPESRGSVLGLLKGFVGLSGAIMTQIYHSIYGNDSKSLVLLIAWLPSAISFVFLGTIRVIKPIHRENEGQVFNKFLYISLGLAGFLMALIIVQNKFSFSRIGFIGSGCVVIFFLFFPLFIVFKEDFGTWKSTEATINNQSTVQVVTEVPHVQTPTENAMPVEKEKQTCCCNNILKPPARGEDYTILQALFSIDMIILFVASTCGLGGTLTAINNLGQIGNSLGYPSRTTRTFVSLVSIWNYLGRVVAGFTSEFLLKKYKISRTLLFSLTLLVSCAGHLLIAFGVQYSLYFASVIIGFCFGAQWPLLLAIISEIFGLKYYSTLSNFGSMASPVGSYILNVKVAGDLYDKEAKKHREARETGQDLICNGVHCYKVAFLIIAASTFFGCLISFILVLRTNKFYKGDIYDKFPEDATNGREMDNNNNNCYNINDNDNINSGTDTNEYENMQINEIRAEANNVTGSGGDSIGVASQ